MKRIFIGFCCVLLLLCTAAGCADISVGLSTDNTTPPTTAVAAPDTLTVAYNKADTLNPYSAATQINLYLATLLYESPLTVDAQFTPQSGLCEIEETTATSVKVKLRKGAVFSDGSAVTAQDVVYAFNKAKQSANYRAMVSNISSAVAKGRTVTFTYATPNIYGAADLIFPVIKSSTDTAAAATAPIGSGAYVYDPATATMTRNPKDKVAAQITTIRLYHAVSNAEVLHALRNGSVDYMFNDLGDGNIPRTLTPDTSVPLNHLVYLGVNGTRGATADARVRQALSYAVNRTAIAANAYAGRALAATSPFHPNWKQKTGTAGNFSVTDDAAHAKALIKQAQTVPLTTTGATLPTNVTTTATTTATTVATTTPTAGTLPTLELIYPDGNSCRNAAVKMLVSAFEHSGITVNAVALPYETYLSRLKDNNFDLYFGEIRLTPDMNLSVFLKTGGTAAYGIANPQITTAYDSLRTGGITPDAFCETFLSEMPYIPLCWLQGVAAYNARFSAVTPSAYNVFDGILHWK